jgi:hypothetical protein
MLANAEATAKRQKSGYSFEQNGEHCSPRTQVSRRGNTVQH